MSKKLRLNKWYVVEGSNSYTKVRRLRAYRLNIIATLIALGVFIAILSTLTLKADTTPISERRERCTSLYDGPGQIRSECKALINQSIKQGVRPMHETADPQGDVRWLN